MERTEPYKASIIRFEKVGKALSPDWGRGKRKLRLRGWKGYTAVHISM